MRSDSFRGFLRWLIACSLLIGTTTIVLVVVMDPYRVFGTRAIKGLNEVKPYPDRYQREIKLAMAVRNAADVLILGNSRAEIGLDPEYEGFFGQLAYNLAVPGSGLDVAHTQLREFIDTHGRPKRVLVGLDMIDFLVREEPDGPSYIESVEDPLAAWRWKFHATFSVGALWNALTMIRLQHDPYASRLTERGLNPLSEYPQIARRSGYYALFQQRAQESARLYARLPNTVETAHSLSPTFETLRRILDLCSSHDVPVDFIIYPVHAQMMFIMEQAGLRKTTKQWKALLVREIRSTTLPSDQSIQFRLWDFSGFGGARCEPIPSEADRATVTQWYWEAGHFKRALGDLILNSVISSKPPTPVLSGSVLDASNLDENELRIDIERHACLSAHPLLAAEVRTIVGAALQSKSIP